MESEQHILVVDDDRELRNLISRFLHKNGFRVDVAADGLEMSQALSQSKIDLVILDRVVDIVRVSRRIVFRHVPRLPLFPR